MEDLQLSEGAQAHAHDRGQLRMPAGLRAALDTMSASPTLRHCALDLWQRSSPGTTGRMLVLSADSQRALVFGVVTVADAARALVEADLLEGDVETDEMSSWRWLVDDSPLASSAVVPTGVFAKVPASERAAILARGFVDRRLPRDSTP